MPEIQRSIVINRPISEVFAFFADAENDPQWRTGVVEIKRLGDLGVGVRFRQRVAGPAGRAIAADVEVTAYQPETHAAFRTISGPVRPRGSYSFRDLNGTTEVTFGLAVELSGIKKALLTNAVQKTMEAEVAGLDRAKVALGART